MRLQLLRRSLRARTASCVTLVVPHLVGDVGICRSPCQSPEMRW